MKKICIKCGKEEPFDYFSEAQEKMFVCDSCVRKSEEQVEMELKQKYHAEKQYEDKFEKVSFSSILKFLIYSIIVITVISTFLHVIGNVADYMKLYSNETVIYEEDREETEDESEAVAVNYDIRELLQTVHCLNYNEFNKRSSSNYDGMSNRDSSVESGAEKNATYVAEDESVTIVINSKNSYLKSFEVNEYTDRWTYGNASLCGTYSDLENELLTDGATYNNELGCFELEANELIYRIRVNANVDGDINEFKITCIE